MSVRQRRRVIDRLLFARTHAAWTPLQLPALALWLDAADPATLVLADTKISQWLDKSGHNRHVNQGTDAARPTYTAGGLNGRPVITFAAAQTMAGTGFSHAGILSVGAVSKVDSAANAIFQIGASNEAGFLRVDGSQFWEFRGGSSGGGRIAHILAAITTVSGVLTATQSDIWKNGTAGTPSSVASATATNLSLTVGGLSASSYRMTGFIAELVLTAYALSTDERSKLEGYLAWKWGQAASLPAGHPYKATAP